MKSKHAPSSQLLLMLPARTVEIPKEIEPQVVSALAELLLVVAMGGTKLAEGGRDERQDPR
jgi:hypothetical protein